eukprot:CAMPEP_0197629570 /NCGR_PEP_ID=MMETSP1338-20131121/7370_1 /TAXON_ID=43686 ORGANISM="Pelagodinium beii, Strain RCC1491" /NCGR_SAMPLE_ID=MMETSP1338 /ASSEMBLY_ACC=CAM_ASM_000754 /LENGTH=341 /DNA_ID=CAMNT_0043200635 /DNA_START=39 /DNA_END=1061 /DNA_ORIENTATION=-
MAAEGTFYGACQLPETLPDAMDIDVYKEILKYLKEHPEQGHRKLSREQREREAFQTLDSGADKMKQGLYYVCPCCRNRSKEALAAIRELGDDGIGHDFTEEELALRTDFAANKEVWYADYWMDLWCFTRNTNPIMALCYSHPLHPISRNERIAITILQIVFMMMITSAVPRAQGCINAGMGCPDAWAEASDDEKFCCLAHNVGITWTIKNLSLGFGLGGAVYAIITNFLFAQLLYQCGAGCVCFQDVRASLRRFCELLGHILMVAVFLLMIYPTWIFTRYNIVHGAVGETVITFLESKPTSIVLTTVIQTLLFTALWTREMRDPDRLERGIEVTAWEYWAW